MTTPRFNSTDLASHSVRRRWHGPQQRLATASLPGVDGALVSFFGQGPRRITGIGYLQAGGLSAASADESLQDAIREVHSECMQRVGTFVDIDGQDYPDCVLVRYDPVSPVEIQAGDVFLARQLVAFEILQQDPT